MLPLIRFSPEDAPTEWMAVTGLRLVLNVEPWRPNPSVMFLAFFFFLGSGYLALVEVGTILGGSVSRSAALHHDGSLRQTTPSAW